MCAHLARSNLKRDSGMTLSHAQGLELSPEQYAEHLSDELLRRAIKSLARRYIVTMTDYSALPVCEFAFPGALRDQLVAAVLDGSKTSTTAMLIGYEIDQEDLPVVGLKEVVIDSAGTPVAVIEMTEVRQTRLAEVDLQHAIDEGEGFITIDQWRAGHEEFWHSQDIRDELNDPHFTVNDDTVLVLQRFRVVSRLP